jgi:hypothetical protein
MKKTIKHKKIFRHPFTYKEKLLLWNWKQFPYSM